MPPEGEAIGIIQFQLLAIQIKPALALDWTLLISHFLIAKFPCILQESHTVGRPCGSILQPRRVPGFLAQSCTLDLSLCETCEFFFPSFYGTVLTEQKYMGLQNSQGTQGHIKAKYGVRLPGPLCEGPGELLWHDKWQEIYKSKRKMIHRNAEVKNK